jgi:hypothetical protein
MAARRRVHGGAVPLFGLEAPRPARRVPPALERSLTELRSAGVDEGPAGPTIRALVRDMGEEWASRRGDESLYALSTMAGRIVELLRFLAGDDVGAASFDELRELLSSPPVDGEES